MVVAYLTDNRLEIGGSPTLVLLVAVTLLGEVLVDLKVGEHGGLRLDDLHLGGWLQWTMCNLQ